LLSLKLSLKLPLPLPLPLPRGISYSVAIWSVADPVAVTGNRHRYPWPHRIWCCLLSLPLPLPLERREAGEE
jgi:hypothetical protein